MKVLNVVRCPQCKRFLELEPSDLIEHIFPVAYRVRCPKPCNTTINIPPQLVEQLAPTTEAETVSSPPPSEVTDEDKVRKARAAAEALKTHGSYARAAEALGVSATTVKNWLEHLPAGAVQD